MAVTILWTVLCSKFLLLLLFVGLPVANAPDVLQPCGYCTTLNVQTLTTTRLQEILAARGGAKPYYF